MKLVDNVIRSMRVAKLYKDNTEQITNIHYSNDGQSIITSSADDQIIIYDCEKGTQKRVLNSKKYGVDLIHFTQNKGHAVHASTKENDIIRYMSLTENKYIRYFGGHDKRVVTMAMNPADETFLSGSLDKSIRLWDLRSNHCQGLMKLAGRPVAACQWQLLILTALSLLPASTRSPSSSMISGPLTRAPFLPSNFKQTAKKLSGLDSSSLQMASPSSSLQTSL